MNEIPVKAYAVSAFVCRRDAAGWKVLLLRRVGERLDGTWCQVGGAVEAGETAWQTALREIREETGLIAERLYSADICEQFYEAEPECVAVAPVFVAFVDSEQPVILDREHSEFRWATFDEAESLLPFAGQRNVLRHVEREFILRPPNELLRIDSESR
jgi:dATP pyrophosphohydrolase